MLLTGTDETRAERPMLVYQRYGRGKSFAFLPQDSWMWQMHSTMAVEDLTHENFWRQLMRWLVDGVPDQVEPTFASERVEPGEAAMLTASVVDPSFVELNDASVMVTVTGPDGAIVDVPMSWDGEHPGEYSAAIPTKAPGWYEARLDATRGGKSVGTAITHFRAAPGDAGTSTRRCMRGRCGGLRKRRAADSTSRVPRSRSPTTCGTPDAGSPPLKNTTCGTCRSC